MNTIVTTAKFEGSGFPYTEEYKTIQEWARNSWANLEFRVLVYNKIGQVYTKDLANELKNYDVSGMVNADCILTSPVNTVFDKLRSIKEPAWATSFRYSFNLEDYPHLENSRVIQPYGLDIFIGNQLFWEAWYDTCEPTLSRLGLIEDNILCSFGNEHFPDNSYDFTKLRCVFHPNHSNESRIQDRSFNTDTKMTHEFCYMPKKKIRPQTHQPWNNIYV